MEKNVTVSGTGNIVNVAEFMSGVTNTVNNNLQQSSIDDDVKKLVTELSQQIEAIAKEADPAQTQKLGKNLERLSDEMTSNEPDKRWYELSLEGLKEAAEAIGAIATPVIATVTKLSALLLA